jgi:hypothetical protein
MRDSITAAVGNAHSVIGLLRFAECRVPIDNGLEQYEAL